MAKYRKYSKEFKLQAAKLATEQGYSYDQTGKRLGTTGWSIRHWIQKFQQTGESFFGILKNEWVKGKLYETHEDAIAIKVLTYLLIIKSITSGWPEEQIISRARRDT